MPGRQLLKLMSEPHRFGGIAFRKVSTDKVECVQHPIVVADLFEELDGFLLKRGMLRIASFFRRTASDQYQGYRPVPAQSRVVPDLREDRFDPLPHLGDGARFAGRQRVPLRGERDLRCGSRAGSRSL
jgi:hypothetical protein